MAAPALAASIEERANIDLSSEPAVVGYYASLPPLWASVHLAGGYAGKPFTETSLLEKLHEILHVHRPA